MITIHVGLHKTGSSSIQVALRLAERSRGVTLRTPVPEQVLGDRQFVEGIIIAQRTGRVVLSDEGFLGRPEDAYADAPRRLAQLRQAFAGAPYEIVVYLRPQPLWLESVYLQLIQMGRAVTVSQFWEAIASQPYLSWTRLVRLLADEGGATRVIVRAHVPGRDAVADFFGCVGLPDPPRLTQEGYRENVSIAAAQAPILAALTAQSALTQADRIHLRHLFQSHLAPGAPRGLSAFPVELQQEMARMFRSDWVDLAAFLAATDPAEAAVCRESQTLFDASPRPFAGQALTDPVISAELLRTITALAVATPESTQSGLGKRIAAKLRSNPRDFFAAARRALRSRG